MLFQLLSVLDQTGVRDKNHDAGLSYARHCAAARNVHIFFIRRTKSPIARENVDDRENDVSGENDACRENDAVKENGISRENDDTDVSKSGLMFFGSADGLKRAS